MESKVEPNSPSVFINTMGLGIDKIVMGAVVGALNALADEGAELTPARLKELAKEMEDKASCL